MLCGWVTGLDQQRGASELTESWVTEMSNSCQPKELLECPKRHAVVGSRNTHYAENLCFGQHACYTTKLRPKFILDLVSVAVFWIVIPF